MWWLYIALNSVHEVELLPVLYNLFVFINLFYFWFQKQQAITSPQKKLIRINESLPFDRPTWRSSSQMMFKVLSLYDVFSTAALVWSFVLVDDLRSIEEKMAATNNRNIVFSWYSQNVKTIRSGHKGVSVGCFNESTIYNFLEAFCCTKNSAKLQRNSITSNLVMQSWRAGATITFLLMRDSQSLVTRKLKWSEIVTCPKMRHLSMALERGRLEPRRSFKWNGAELLLLRHVTLNAPLPHSHCSVGPSITNNMRRSGHIPGHCHSAQRSSCSLNIIFALQTRRRCFNRKTCELSPDDTALFTSTWATWPREIISVPQGFVYLRIKASDRWETQRCALTFTKLFLLAAAGESLVMTMRKGFTLTHACNWALSPDVLFASEALWECKPGLTR